MQFLTFLTTPALQDESLRAAPPYQGGDINLVRIIPASHYVTLSVA